MIIEAESCWDFPATQDGLDVSPQATHALYFGQEKWPEITRAEANDRLGRFRDEGYEAIFSVLCLGPSTVQQALRMEAKANVLLADGGLIGPYILGEQVVEGVRIFRRMEENHG